MSISAMGRIPAAISDNENSFCSHHPWGDRSMKRAGRAVCRRLPRTGKSMMKRWAAMGGTWHVDETDIRVKGRWCYLYRAMDEDGNLVDSWLQEHRDIESTQAFFEQALGVAQTPPNRVVTDGLAMYPRAIAEVLGEAVIHEPGSCLDNPIEQDHRGIKHRYYPMLGFGAFESAKRFCEAFEEMRQYLRTRSA